jgi:hypothetical protein
MLNLEQVTAESDSRITAEFERWWNRLVARQDAKGLGFDKYHGICRSAADCAWMGAVVAERKRVFEACKKLGIINPDSVNLLVLDME